MLYRRSLLGIHRKVQISYVLLIVSFVWWFSSGSVHSFVTQTQASTTIPSNTNHTVPSDKQTMFNLTISSRNDGYQMGESRVFDTDHSIKDRMSESQVCDTTCDTEVCDDTEDRKQSYALEIHLSGGSYDHPLPGVSLDGSAVSEMFEEHRLAERDAEQYQQQYQQRQQGRKRFTKTNENMFWRQMKYDIFDFSFPFHTFDTFPKGNAYDYNNQQEPKAVQRLIDHHCDFFRRPILFIQIYHQETFRPSSIMYNGTVFTGFSVGNYLTNTADRSKNKEEKKENIRPCDFVLHEFSGAFTEFPPVQTQMSEMSAIIPFGLLLSSSETFRKLLPEWIGFGTWQQQTKAPLPRCDYTKPLFADAHEKAVIVWNVYLNTDLAKQAEISHGQVFTTLLQNIIRHMMHDISVARPGNVVSNIPRLGLPCCTHFFMRQTLLQTFAKFQSILYILLKDMMNDECPYYAANQKRCWAYLAERLAVYFYSLHGIDLFYLTADCTKVYRYDLTVKNPISLDSIHNRFASLLFS